MGNYIWGYVNQEVKHHCLKRVGDSSPGLQMDRVGVSAAV
jgi:hypothetical protein